MTNRSTHFDEIERLLREALGDYAPPAPERVWKRVEARLHKRRRPLIGWWLAGMGLAVLLGGLAMRKMQGDKPTVAAPQAAAPVVGSSVNAFENTVANAALLPGGDVPVRQMPTDDALPMRKHSVLQKQATQTSPEQVFQLITPINAVVADSGQVMADSFDTSDVIVLSPLPTLPPPQLAIAQRIESLSSLTVEIPRRARSNQWSVGLHIAPVWQWQKLAGMNQTGHIPVAEHTQNPATGLQSGISIAYQLNPRWRVESGLWQQTTTHIYSDIATLRLMDGINLNPNDPGAKQYEFRYALPSNGGIPTEVVLLMEEVDPTSHIPNDEPFVVTMQTRLRSTEWLVPLSMQRLLGYGRWKSTLRGGAMLGFSGRANAQVKQFSKAHTGLYFPDGHIPVVTIVDYNKMALHYLFGAGIEYRLAPRWRLSFEQLLTGRRGQTSISASAGLFYHF